MNTILIIVGLLAFGAAVLVVLQKTGKVKDSDGDYIPDVVEETLEKTKAEYAEASAKAKKAVKKTKAKAKKVKETAKNVIEEAKEAKQAFGKAFEEAQDVVEALQGLPVIEGKVTKTKLRALSKEDLETILTKKFKVELTADATKTNLVNRVYELYYPNKK